jgi:hypothetical protein
MGRSRSESESEQGDHSNVKQTRMPGDLPLASAKVE